MEILPDEVKVSARSGWEYNRIYTEGPNAMKIVEKHSDHGISFVDEYFTDGVRPVGTKIGIDILKKALKACQFTDVDLKKIT